MDCPAHGSLRVLRALASGAAVLALSATAHALGGGALPSAAVLAGVGVAACAVSWQLAGRRSTTSGLLALLTAGQLALHLVLSVLAPAVTGRSGIGPAGTGMPMGSGWTADAGMLAAHAVATGLLALLLTRGEDALWALWAWLVPLAAALLARHVRVPVRDAPTPPPPPHPVVRHLVLLAADPRRGPPEGARG